MVNVQSVKAQAQFVPRIYPVRVVRHVGERYDGLYRYHRHHLHMRTFIEGHSSFEFFFFFFSYRLPKQPACVFGLPIPPFSGFCLSRSPGGWWLQNI